jgi:hypothetical protein
MIPIFDLKWVNRRRRNEVKKTTFHSVLYEHIYSPFSSLDSSLNVDDEERFDWFLRTC